ncbi:hypothetical protein [Catenuloplanes atrovinosus]|uniref:Uncharacterized protein n=1 Tax=Catenuloplanes atrovinosus TaxID=137266 RepID=A0AAE3YLL3_9ACTN|nr:hypothetical protein [Catenuloplanes atrovinosus]MDR7275765.1 hypothetical protein [Catenuloplanes atrovinosus]
MHTNPIMIPGVAGWVSVTLPALGRPAITVNGMPAQRLRGSDFLLPGAAGAPVLVKLKTGLAEPFPSILTVDATYRTGPPLPGYLKALALLPILFIPLGGVLFGAVFAVPAIIANLRVSRSPLSALGKLAAIAAIDLGAILAIISVIIALATLVE